jgi:hypothetical protein
MAGVRDVQPLDHAMSPSPSPSPRGRENVVWGDAA